MGRGGEGQFEVCIFPALTNSILNLFLNTRYCKYMDHGQNADET